MKIRILALFFSIAVCLPLLGQIDNDNWKDAYNLLDKHEGFIDTLVESQPSSFINKGVERQESFSKSFNILALNQKTVWYKFKINTQKDVEIRLRQKDTIIPSNNVGMVVFKSNSNDYPNHNLPFNADPFPQITQFGSIKLSCANPGTYFVQVCARKDVVDSIFIELQIGASNKQGNTASNALKATDKSSYFFDNTCFSISSKKELGSYKLGRFTKSTYFTFKTPDKIDRFNTGFKGKDFVAQYFEGTVNNPNAWVLTKEYANFKKFNKSFIDTFSCGGPFKTNTNYVIKVLYNKGSELSFTAPQISAGKETLGTNPLNVANDKGIIVADDIAETIEWSEYVSCNSNGTEHLCSTQQHLLIDTINVQNGSPIVDTINFGIWYTFTLKNRAEVEFIFSGPALKYGNVRRVKAWLFKGEYSDGFCSETPYTLSSGYYECLGAGTYTVFTGFFKNDKERAKYKNVYSGVYLRNKITVISKSGDEGRPSLYSDPSFSSKIVNLGYGKNYEKRKTSEDWLNGPLDTIEIDGETLIGHFSFNTVSTAIDAYLKIWPANDFDHQYRVFSGDCTNGLETLKNDVFSFIGKSEDSKTTQLKKLPKGTYTIMSFREPNDLCNPPKNHNAQYFVVATTIEDDENGGYPCKSDFYHAAWSGKINYGKPLKWDLNPNNGVSKFGIPTTCKDKVNNNGNYNVYNTNAHINKKTEAVLYYEFELAEKSEVLIRPNSPWQLLKGSISKDSGICKSSENVVEEFAQQLKSYCSLAKGTYTLICILEKDASGGYINVSEFHKSPNDFARHAIDMGVLDQNNPVVSATSGINCETQIDSPKFNSKGIWFTFKSSGRAKITYENLPSPLSAALYKSTRAKGESFEYLKQNNLVDSLLFENLERPQRDYENQSTYIQLQADTARYYFYVSVFSSVFNPVENYNGAVNIKITYQGDENASPLGDFCSNAIEATINGVGTEKAELWTSAHTLGEGPNEQNSEGWCSNSSSVYNTKSSWIKLKVENNNGNRLRVRATGNAEEIKMYTGNCGALTPAFCLVGTNGEVTLDCIADGEYFFQVFTGIHDWSYSGIEVETLPKDGSCRLIDLEKPFAHFLYTGGCGDSVRFKNLSTYGNDIEYQWHFGDGNSTSKTHPSHYYTNAKSVDSFKVSLVVKNTANGRRDSVSQYVYIQDIGERSWIIRDTVACSDSIVLRPKDSNPLLYNYGWHYGYKRIERDDTFYISMYKSEITADSFMVKNNLEGNLMPISIDIRSARCFKTERIHVYFANDQSEKYIATICQGQPDTVKIKKPFWADSISWLDTTNHQWKRELTKPGRYDFEMRGSGCTATNKVVTHGYTQPVYSLSDTLCANDTLDIKDLTDQFTLVSYNGNRSIRLDPISTSDSIITLEWYPRFFGAKLKERCWVRDTVQFPNFFSYQPLPIDTSFCEGDSILLSATHKNAQVVWNNKHNSNSIKIDSVGKYFVRLKFGHCLAFDTFNVSEISRLKNNLNDTTVCDLTTGVELGVKAGANLYQWSTGEYGDTIRLYQEGEFWLKTNVKHCVFTDSFKVLNDCPPQLYIPNAFTPGNDNLNPTFIAKGTEIENYEMRIYAQNGQSVFYTNNLSEGWDGTVRFEPAPLGTYYYVITYTLNGESRVESGNLSLIK
ncbi:MAG: gliding motility-associated C-terminal domain-containing protein [Bacteroidia bacterium]